MKELDFHGDGELAEVRRFVRRGAREARLSQRATEDLVLAVSELATNSLQYGGGEGICRMWSEGGTLLCEVRDSGYIREPLAGRVRPAPGQARGRGLWVVNQICRARSDPLGRARNGGAHPRTPGLSEGAPETNSIFS